MVRPSDNKGSRSSALVLHDFKNVLPYLIWRTLDGAHPTIEEVLRGDYRIYQDFIRLMGREAEFRKMHSNDS